jgi:predicted RNA methylase
MISTHILDTSIGQPAAGVEVILEKFDQGKWLQVATDKTNGDGRIAYAIERSPGDYRLIYKNEMSSTKPQYRVVISDAKAYKTDVKPLAQFARGIYRSYIFPYESH